MTALLRRLTICILCAALLTGLARVAMAQWHPTSIMIFYGTVRDVRGQPVDGVTLTFRNTTRGTWGSTVTPTLPGKPGSYFARIEDVNNQTVARSNDSISVTITDPQNRLGRTPRVTPSYFNLLLGDAAACKKRQYFWMY